MITVKLGDRVWHRIFGWCTVTRASDISETVCIDSEHKHVQQYVMGYGWKDYIGTAPDGHIEMIAVKKHELYNEPQNDRIQSILSLTLKIVK